MLINNEEKIASKKRKKIVNRLHEHKECIEGKRITTGFSKHFLGSHHNFGPRKF